MLDLLYLDLLCYSNIATFYIIKLALLLLLLLLACENRNSTPVTIFAHASHISSENVKIYSVYYSKAYHANPF